mgnify:CR=1 FL=1
MLVLYEIFVFGGLMKSIPNIAIFRIILKSPKHYFDTSYLNPDAEEDKSSPLFGMPIFRPWTAKTVFVVKRGKGTGFSGVENPLFTKDNTLMIYGDAKGVLGNLVKEIKALDEGH